MKNRFAFVVFENAMFAIVTGAVGASAVVALDMLLEIL